MSNIWAYEAIQHFLDNKEGLYTEKQIKQVERIKNAFLNYEARDVILSIAWNFGLAKIWHGFSLRVGKDVKFSNRKRFIKFGEKKYPFKQSAPKILYKHYMNNLLPLCNIVREFTIKDELSELVDTIYNFMKKNHTYINTDKFFFCNKAYTEATGVKPHVVCNYNELVEKQVEYIRWKIGFNKDKLGS